MLKLKINPEYLELVPRPDKIQLNMLKHSIMQDGQQVSIIANSEGVILDGHTRFNICNELGLIPKYTIKKFPSRKKEKEFVISANLNRRQLTLFERGEILFSWWKSEKKKSQSQGGAAAWQLRRTGIESNTTTNGKKERLLQRFAKIIGSSASVCHQLTWLLIHAPEEYKIKLRREEITIAAAYVLLKKPDYKTAADYRAEGRKYLSYPNCLNCNSRMTPNKKTNCHVHDKACCTKCGWGY